MNIVDFEKICEYALAEFREQEPNATGNMARNATKLKYDYASPKDGIYSAHIFIDPSVAPYSIYTVIDWRDTSPIIINAPRAPHLKGKSSFLWNKGDTPEASPKKNPNQGWIDGAVKHLANYIARIIGGVVEKNDG